MQSVWDAFWSPEHSLFVPGPGFSADKREGQYVLKIKAGSPPQNETLLDFHPFQIYKPDFSLINPNKTAFCFADDGALTQILIDNTVPTSLVNGNGTVNLLKDGWRVWAVRTGRISIRNYGELPVSTQFFYPGSQISLLASDLGESTEVFGCDGLSPGGPAGGAAGYDTAGFPYEYNPEEGSPLGFIFPIVLPGTFPKGSNTFAFSLYIGGAGGSYFPSLNGIALDLSVSGNDKLLFPIPATSDTMPIGCISCIGYKGYASPGTNALTAYQFQYGNVENRQGCYENSFLSYAGISSNDPLVYSAGLNFRGSWQNDLHLNENVYYPGDVIKFQEQINFTATGGISITPASLFVQQLYMCGVVGFTSDPSTDSNFSLISGITGATDPSPTPDTT